MGQINAVLTGPEPEWVDDSIVICSRGSPIPSRPRFHTANAMSIIRPFRADDLFRFNNMCVGIALRTPRLVSLDELDDAPCSPPCLSFPAISTSGPKRCVV
jgi:hypothetical protein